MLDKNTFGVTPAAIYLASRLNTINSKKFTRRISATMQQYRKMMNEVVAGYNCEALSVGTVGSIMNSVNDNLDKTVVSMLSDRASYDTPDLPCFVVCQLNG